MLDGLLDVCTENDDDMIYLKKKKKKKSVFRDEEVTQGQDPLYISLADQHHRQWKITLFT